MQKETREGNTQARKVAFITGCTGQDGSFLAEILLEKGYEVHGFVRRSSTFNRQRINHLQGKIHLHYGDMTDPFSIMWALKASKPDEVYNLAAQSHVQVSWETPWYTAQTTGIGVLNILEACRVLEITPRIYQASTSELFNGRESSKQNENTPKDPVSPYGTAKLYGFQIAKNYRDAFGMFICNGILFNHESERRGINFVTMKIVHEAMNDRIVRLGNTSASRDWGYAREYMEAAWLMLQQEKPDDYVIATGETHTVSEFMDWVSAAMGKRVLYSHGDEYDRPVDVPKLCGDATKAATQLGWKPEIVGEKLAELMVNKYEKTD